MVWIWWGREVARGASGATFLGIFYFIMLLSLPVSNFRQSGCSETFWSCLFLFFFFLPVSCTLIFLSSCYGSMDSLSSFAIEHWDSFVCSFLGVFFMCIIWLWSCQGTILFGKTTNPPILWTSFYLEKIEVQMYQDEVIWQQEILGLFPLDWHNPNGTTAKKNLF